MGGPGAEVLLRNPLTKQQVDSLDLWLQSIVTRGEGDFTNGYSFWLKEDAFNETVSQCRFSLEMHDPTNWLEEDENKQLVEHLGYLPQQAIGIGSYCNQKSDHFTLGLLVLHLAELYDGPINMGGAIIPLMRPSPVSKDFFAKQRLGVDDRKAYLQKQFDALKACCEKLVEHCV